MTYDMYGAWDPVTGHNAPLHRSEGDSVANEASLFTVENAVKYWLRAGKTKFSEEYSSQL